MLTPVMVDRDGVSDFLNRSFTGFKAIPEKTGAQFVPGTKYSRFRRIQLEHRSNMHFLRKPSPCIQMSAEIRMNFMNYHKRETKLFHLSRNNLNKNTIACRLHYRSIYCGIGSDRLLGTILFRIATLSMKWRDNSSVISV